MCLSCGYYKGRQVLDLATLKTDRAARIKAKQDRMGVDTGVSAPEATREVVADTTKEEKGEEVAKKTRTGKTGASSKKAKQETA